MNIKYLQKTTFYGLKSHISHYERPPFVIRKATFYIFAKLVGHSIQRLTQKQVFLIFSIIYPQLKNLILQIIIIQYNDYQQQHGVST